MIIIVAVSICFPLLVLRVMQHSNHDVYLILTAFDLFIKLLMYVALLKSLHLIAHGALTKRDNPPDIFNITNLLFFISSFGSFVYFSLQVVSSFSASSIFTIKSLINIVVT